MKEVRRLAGDTLHVAVQVSDASAACVRENIVQAQDCGADTVVIAAPTLSHFITLDFLRRYFLESIESASIPVGLYVLPAAAGSPLDLRLWLELAGRLSVKVLKDSTGSAETRNALATLRQDREDLLLLTGDEFNVLPAIDGRV